MTRYLGKAQNEGLRLLPIAILAWLIVVILAFSLALHLREDAIHREEAAAEATSKAYDECRAIFVKHPFSCCGGTP